MTPLLQLVNVSKAFSLKGRGKIKALRNVSLEIFEGETLGVVGESGCGKSTLAKTVMGVYPSMEGRLYFRGSPLSLRTRKDRLAYSEKVQMVFQDPYTALDPRMRVGDLVAESLVIHQIGTSGEKKARVRSILEEVGLPADCAGRFPSEFSGGQRQRIGIARALALRPELLICDEPLSALDVSIQSQIMNLLKRLKTEQGLTYLFIAHDLNMVRYLSDRTAVMYRGEVVELGSSDVLAQTPLHPYTQLLSQAVLTPVPGPLAELPETELPQAVQPGKGRGMLPPAEGCLYADRCPHATGRCTDQSPTLQEAVNGHFVACHHAG